MVQLVINATTAMAGEAGWTLALPATAVIEFMAKWLNLYPHLPLDCGAEAGVIFLCLTEFWKAVTLNVEEGKVGPPP